MNQKMRFDRVSEDNVLITGSTDGSSVDELYDDCAICQLIKKAKKENREPTMQELMEAFDKANNHNESKRIS